MFTAPKRLAEPHEVYDRESHERASRAANYHPPECWREHHDCAVQLIEHIANTDSRTWHEAMQWYQRDRLPGRVPGQMMLGGPYLDVLPWEIDTADEDDVA